MRIVRVTELSDLEALFRFRYRIFVEDLGWSPPQPAGLLSDEYDALAYNYAALADDGLVVGSVRVVPDGLLGLPLERYAPPNALDGYRQGRALAEVSRLALHQAHSASRLGGLLMKTAFERAEMIGATHVVLDTSVGGSAIRQFEKMGFTRVGEEYTDRYHLGTMRCATLSQRVRDVHEVWPSARPGLHRFFTSIEPCIEHM